MKGDHWLLYLSLLNGPCNSKCGLVVRRPLLLLAVTRLRISIFNWVVCKLNCLAYRIASSKKCFFRFFFFLKSNSCTFQRYQVNLYMYASSPRCNWTLQRWKMALSHASNDPTEKKKTGFHYPYHIKTYRASIISTVNSSHNAVYTVYIHQQQNEAWMLHAACCIYHLSHYPKAPLIFSSTFASQWEIHTPAMRTFSEFSALPLKLEWVDISVEIYRFVREDPITVGKISS